MGDRYLTAPIYVSGTGYVQRLLSSQLLSGSLGQFLIFQARTRQSSIYAPLRLIRTDRSSKYCSASPLSCDFRIVEGMFWASFLRPFAARVPRTRYRLLVGIPRSIDPYPDAPLVYLPLCLLLSTSPCPILSFSCPLPLRLCCWRVSLPAGILLIAGQRLPDVCLLRRPSAAP